MNHLNCCPFIAAQSREVRAFILDAYMRYWHLRIYNYIFICVIGK